MDPVSAQGLGKLANLDGGIGKVGGKLGKVSEPGKFESLRKSKFGAKQADPIASARNLLKTGKVDAAAPTMMERVAARDQIAFTRIPGLDHAQSSDQVWQATKVEATGNSQQVASAIGELNSGQERLQEIIGQLRSGKDFSHDQLIGIQAEVHLLSEQVQMSSKLVDSAMQSLKQVMQQQA